jgi:hypothetical protein
MDEDGRWIRVTRALRDALLDEAQAGGCENGRTAALDVAGLYDSARPEDWIGQLTEINRELSEQNAALRHALQLHPKSA